MRFNVIITFDKEYHGYVVDVPLLTGCMSQDKTKEEAVENIREAIQGYVAVLEEDHLPVPPENFEALIVAV